MTFSENVIRFLGSLGITARLPEGVGILDPYSEKTTMDLTCEFFHKFYSDHNPRVFLIGINPGRFGGGVTGVAFTDPLNLEEKCGIPNDLDKRRELSSRFIYDMIKSMGTVADFYSSFYFSSVSPLGFVREGKNLNYYDIPELQKVLEPFIVESLKRQVDFGAYPVGFSLGMGKNIKYLQYLNDRYSLFREVRALPHPRWIMQYRSRRVDEFKEMYKRELLAAVSMS